MDLENQSRLIRSAPKCKAVIVGDQSVGKSSIIRRYAKKVFQEKYNTTVGIDFISKVVNLANGREIRLQIWDTAGQQRFRSLIPGYLKDCGAAIVVFDLTSIHSYEAIGGWIDSVKDSRGNEALIVLVANKCDIEQQAISQEQLDDLQRKYGRKVNKVSALSGEGVQQLFSFICEELQKKYANTITSFGDTMQLAEESRIGIHRPRAKKCCST